MKNHNIPLLFRLQHGQMLFSIMNAESFEQFPIDIQRLLNNKFYDVQSIVSKKSMKIFRKLCQTGTLPVIGKKKFSEIKNLAHEFRRDDLIAIIDCYSSKIIEGFDNNNERVTNQNDDSIEIITSNLDDYISNNPKELMNKDFDVIYQIFFSPKRKLNNHNAAFSFINQLAAFKNDSDYFILFGSLNIKKLTHKNVKQMLKANVEICSNEFFTNVIVDADKTIKLLTENNANLTANMKKLGHSNEEQKIVINRFQDQINTLQKQINDLRNDSIGLKENMSKLTKNTKKLDDLIQKMKLSNESDHKIMSTRIKDVEISRSKFMKEVSRSNFSETPNQNKEEYDEMKERLEQLYLLAFKHITNKDGSFSVSPPHSPGILGILANKGDKEFSIRSSDNNPDLATFFNPDGREFFSINKEQSKNPFIEIEFLNGSIIIDKYIFNRCSNELKIKKWKLSGIDAEGSKQFLDLRNEDQIPNAHDTYQVKQSMNKLKFKKITLEFLDNKAKLYFKSFEIYGRYIPDS